MNTSKDNDPAGKQDVAASAPLAEPAKPVFRGLRRGKSRKKENLEHDPLRFAGAAHRRSRKRKGGQ